VCRCPVPCGSLHFEMADSRTNPWLFELAERGNMLVLIVTNFIASLLLIVLLVFALAMWPLLMLGSAFLGAALYVGCKRRSSPVSYEKACYVTGAAWLAVLLVPLGLAVIVLLPYLLAALLVLPAAMYLLFDLGSFIFGYGSTLLTANVTVEDLPLLGRHSGIGGERETVDVFKYNGVHTIPRPSGAWWKLVVLGKFGLASLWLGTTFWPCLALSLALLPVTACFMCPALCLPRLQRGTAVLVGLIVGFVVYNLLSSQDLVAPEWVPGWAGTGQLSAAGGAVVGLIAVWLLHCPPVTGKFFWGPLWYFCGFPVTALVCGIPTVNKCLGFGALPSHTIVFHLFTDD